MNDQIYRFEISKEAKPITNDQICRALLGKSLKAFAKEIQINAGGKYDELYKKIITKKEVDHELKNRTGNRTATSKREGKGTTANKFRRQA